MATRINYIDKANLAKELGEWLGDYQAGYWITLDSRFRDQIRFEQLLLKTTHRLNDYCYGRAYYKNKTHRLKIIAGIERGKQNDGLHAHLVVMHNNDTKRTIQDINAHVRETWYGLTESTGSIYGSLVHIDDARNVQNRLGYAAKDVNFWLNQGEFNIAFL